MDDIIQQSRIDDKTGRKTFENTSRRGFLKKAVTTSAIAGILGTVATGEALASYKTNIEINHVSGDRVEYYFTVTDSELTRGNTADSSDTTVDGDTAYGFVEGGQDDFNFAKQIDYIRVNSRGPAEVKIRCTQGFGYSGAAAVSIWNFGGRVDYEFCTDGDIYTPGDGSLEWANDGTFPYTSCADGLIQDGEDHWDTDGRLTDLYVGFWGDNYLYLTRDIGHRWSG